MAIKIIIDEPPLGLTDRTGYLAYNGTTSQLFDLVRGQRGIADIPFQVLPGDTYQSTVGSPLYVHEIVDGVDNIAYAGKILTLERTWLGNLGCHLDVLTCTSLEACFDEIRIPPCAYFNKKVGFIARDLFSRLCGGVPVTLGVIADGPVIPSVVYRWDRISDAYDQLVTLATGSNLIWGVNMVDQTLYLKPISTTPAPFVLERVLMETGDWKLDQTDFRNRQLVQISFTAFSTSNEMFDGDSVSQQFDLRVPVDRVVSAMLTTGSQATAVGQFGFETSPFTGELPSPGDTFTITAPHSPPVVEDPYTFVTKLDNTLRNQILIGTDAAEMCQNTVDAINANPAVAGITFSLPTWENDSCNADQPLGGSPADTKFTLRVKNPGSGGNGVVLTVTHATSPGAFHWLSDSTSGGTDGVTSALQVSVAGANTLSTDVQYTPGSKTITFSAPIPAGTSLSVAYYRLGGDTIALEDSDSVAERAAAEHGSGHYEQLITDTQNADARAGYIEAYTALQAFKVIPASFQFVINQALLSTGQLLTIAVVAPSGASATLDGSWLVQEVRAALIPGMQKLPEPFGHLQYTVTVINTLQIADFVVFWENLAKVSPVGAQTVNNLSTSTATPTLNPATPTDTTAPTTPTTGTPNTSAGQQWVQEAPGRYAQWKASDLVVDASDDTIVTSASHAFVAGDVGSDVIVISGTGWTPGEYEISSVTAGAAKLASSPAAVNTTGGVWALVSDDLWCTTWNPSPSFTGNAIIILTKNGLQLDPFAPGEIGPIPGGGDYALQKGNQILFSSAAKPDPSVDLLVATYFPAGLTPAPVGPSATKIAVIIDVQASDFPQPYTPHVPPGSNRHFIDVQVGGGIQEATATISASGTSDLGVIWSMVSSDAHTTDSRIGTLTPSPNGALKRLYTAPAVLPSTLTPPLPDVVVLGVQSHADSTQKAFITITLVVAPGPPPVGNFIALAQGSTTATEIMTSADHLSWSLSGSPTDPNGGQAIASSASEVVALVHDSSFTTFIAIRSTDHGATWTSHSIPQPGTGAYVDLIFADGLFVGLAQDGTVITSPDGVSWTNTATISTVDVNSWNAITFGAGLFVTVGSASGAGQQIIASSPDAATWTLQASPLTSGGVQDWLDVTYGGGQFVAVGNFGGFGGGGFNVATSPDAVTWTPQTAPNHAWFGIAFGAGLYVAVDEGVSGLTMTSPDAITWTTNSVPDAQSCSRIRYINSLFVVGITSPSTPFQSILTSRDGLGWTTQTTAIQDSITDVTFG